MEDIVTLTIAFVAMCLVIYLSFLASKYLAKGSAKVYTTKYITVVDRLALGKDRYIFILKINNKNLLVAVTDSKIEVLKELDNEDLIEQEKIASSISVDSFKQKFTELLSKKNKDDK